MSAQRVERLRVTSTPCQQQNYVVLNGVPLSEDCNQLTSARYVVTIICPQADHLPVKPVVGQHWRVIGDPRFEAVETNGYRYQQHVYDNPEQVECLMPETGESFVQFIANDNEFVGIGTHKAQKLWNQFQGEIYTLLRQETPEGRERLAKVLSDTSITALYEGFQKYRNLEHANWLTKLGVPLKVQKRLFKHHSEKTIDAITHNPYKLLTFGMSFKAVDAIAGEHFHCAPNNDNRLAATLEAAIKKEVGKGHTFASREALLPEVRALTGTTELAAQAFKAGYDRTQFVLHPETHTFHPTAVYIMETVVARRLLHLADQKDFYTPEAHEVCVAAVESLPYALTDQQKRAVVTALDNAVACITGGAGTGKTTVLRTALDTFRALGYDIHAVALSGRAAMRLQESIGSETITVAGLLRSKALIPEHEEHQILLVIHESSMIDIPTMYQIVTHIDPSVHLLLTRDPNQLPPIGCGKVLADIVDSGVIANTTLDIVKRQDGSTGIPEYSKTINEGVVPEHLTTGNITFHETAPAQIETVCTRLFVDDPTNSRVIASTRALVKAISKSCQAVVNAEGKPLIIEFQGEPYRTFFRQGDVVLFTRNDYKLGFQNGSLGVLTSAEVDGDDWGEAKLDTGEHFQVTQSVLDAMDLGYAITLHKAQGSQFPRIIVALTRGRIVDRAWLYTAITRAEAEVHIVGSAQDLRRITKADSHSDQRNSALAALLSNTPQEARLEVDE